MFRYIKDRNTLNSAQKIGIKKFLEQYQEKFLINEGFENSCENATNEWNTVVEETKTLTVVEETKTLTVSQILIQHLIDEAFSQGCSQAGFLFAVDDIIRGVLLPLQLVNKKEILEIVSNFLKIS